MNNKKYMSCEQYTKLFESYGETDSEYLKIHYGRFCETQRQFYENNNVTNDTRLLDVGAHWLHQSLLYAQDGAKVSAIDFPITMEKQSIITMAKENNIQLFSYTDISQAPDFEKFEDNSYDIILFTEFIEHITFNPIEFWKNIYRILSPGGKIILTTPNYYFYEFRFRDLKRLFKRMGGGIPVDDILNIKTYGHHWKEYSTEELKYYFKALSPDFVVSKPICAHLQPGADSDEKSKGAFKKALSQLTKKNIYLEVSLPKKNTGIVINPGWYLPEDNQTKSEEAV